MKVELEKRDVEYGKKKKLDKQVCFHCFNRTAQKVMMLAGYGVYDGVVVVIPNEKGVCGCGCENDPFELHFDDLEKSVGIIYNDKLVCSAFKPEVQDKIRKSGFAYFGNTKVLYQTQN